MILPVVVKTTSTRRILQLLFKGEGVNRITALFPRFEQPTNEGPREIVTYTDRLQD
jgi:hypothetical protein